MKKAISGLITLAAIAVLPRSIMTAYMNANGILVTGKIVEQGRGKKVTVLKFKKTNQYKIQRGHRQNYTAVQVADIKL